MRVQCEHCQAVLNIPDDKLTPGVDFSFNCPKCKNRNTVHVPEAGSGGEAAPAAPEDRLETAAPPTAPAEEEEEGAIGEFYEEGAKLALICFDPGPTRENLVQIMKDLEFVPVRPVSVRDALKRLRVTLFNVVLLHEGFNGQNRDNNSIWRFFLPMETHLRRRTFLAYFGQNFTSLDNMTAFALSVNAVINLADEAHFSKIIYRGLAEYERFYKVFFDVMRELGKT
ncbi:MAG: zinc-ribbon domain-containing protein [Thermodesulfobacteriota bacterium]